MNGAYVIRFLNRFLMYEMLDVHDNLHFYFKISNFNTLAQLNTIHVFRLC